MKTWVEISKDNLLHNIKALKSLAPSSKFMAVVKSNAYGHGIAEVSTICAQSGLVDFFGVDSLDEAIIIRRLGIAKPILVLGYVPFERVGEAMQEDTSIVAYNEELLDYLGGIPHQARDDGKALKIHIKVETGTSRQGIKDDELLEFVKKAKQNPNIKIEGIYTHFANIEDTDDSGYAMEQLKRFKESVRLVEDVGITIPIKHTACSAGIINYPDTHFNMVRAGISLYGLWSVPKNKIELKPVMTWKTKIIQIKKLTSGSPVSYGLTERVKQDSRVAILPIGYWDGYDRGLSSIGEVLIRGKHAKVLGRVCMNMTIVDITDIPEAELFDEVILLGNEISADKTAEKLGTINYEIVTRINPLIKRLIV